MNGWVEAICIYAMILANLPASDINKGPMQQQVVVIGSTTFLLLHACIRSTAPFSTRPSLSSCFSLFLSPCKPLLLCFRPALLNDGGVPIAPRLKLAWEFDGSQ